MKRAGDITHIPAWQGSAHLAVVMDCFTRKIIGHAIAGRMRTGLAARAPAMAARGPPAGPRCRGPPARTEELDARRPNTRRQWVITGFSRPWGGPAAATTTPPPGPSTRPPEEEPASRKACPTRNHATRDVTARTGSRHNHRRLRTAIDHRTPNQADTESRQHHKTAARNQPPTIARKTHITPTPPRTDIQTQPRNRPRPAPGHPTPGKTRTERRKHDQAARPRPRPPSENLFHSIESGLIDGGESATFFKPQEIDSYQG